MLFTTGVQHLADSVKAYQALPSEAKAFLTAVPSAWDETRALSGEPNNSVVVARRFEKTWYVGALNADKAQTVKVNLSFLGPGSFQMTLIRDGAHDRAVDSSTKAVTPKTSSTSPCAPAADL